MFWILSSLVHAMRKGSLALGLRKLWLSAVWFEGVWGGRFRSLLSSSLDYRSLDFFLGFPRRRIIGSFMPLFHKAVLHRGVSFYFNHVITRKQVAKGVIPYHSHNKISKRTW